MTHNFTEATNYYVLIDYRQIDSLSNKLVKFAAGAISSSSQQGDASASKKADTDIGETAASHSCHSHSGDRCNSSSKNNSLGQKHCVLNIGGGGG